VPFGKRSRGTVSRVSTAVGAGQWQDAIERSICRRPISGGSGSIHRASTTARPIRSASFLRDDFELSFDRPITIIAGENGTGKSTLLEGSRCSPDMTKPAAARVTGRSIIPATEVMGGELSEACGRAGFRKLPRAGSSGQRVSFRFARYLDEVSSPYADFLSHSHGEGFLRFFEERCQKQGIFIFDEPEAALSPSRQMEFLKLLRRMEQSTICQVVMATHSPMLMAYPNARLLRLSKYGLDPVAVEQTDHYKVMREFCNDPTGFVEAVVEE